MYLRNIPQWIRLILPNAIYDFKNEKEKVIYLTFDDGPIPEVTEYILDVLKSYQAQATFFCVGENVVRHQSIFRRIIQEGHRVGNHTHNHLDGYKISPAKYYKNILEADRHIQSDLFRPPYGHITYKQSRFLQKKGFRLVMWSMLSADFDVKLKPENMWSYIQKNIQDGDVIVLHDNIKSFEKLKFVLPLILELGQENGWTFKTIK